MSSAETEELLVIEALLFASPHPLTQKQINQIFENDPPKLNSVIAVFISQLEGKGFNSSGIPATKFCPSKPE